MVDLNLISFLHHVLHMSGIELILSKIALFLSKHSFRWVRSLLNVTPKMNCAMIQSQVNFCIKKVGLLAKVRPCNQKFLSFCF